MLCIDGSFGEGGGQVLRTSLSLAIIDQRPVELINIRAGRRKPGLMRQHLTCVEAAAKISDGALKGAHMRSRFLRFRPGKVRAGSYHFAVGSAGSAHLVLQTVLPPLLLADGPSTVVLEGGTHNPWAPAYDFLAGSFLPLLRAMGAAVSIELLRHGFYPAGGGKVRVAVEPGELRPLRLLERGELRKLRARAIVSQLPRKVAERELSTLQKELGIAAADCATVEVPDPAGPGNALVVEAECAAHTMVFVGFGERKKRAERVARELADRVQAWRAAEVPVDEHLADQLLLPFALAGGGELLSTEASSHTRTNLALLQQFRPGLAGGIEALDGGRYRVWVG